jgi:PPOX class probable F420-dependent enzyme
MGVELPETARRLLDGKTYAVLATTNADRSPQSSVIWIKRDGDDVVFSSIRGRRKTRNIERDPRVSVCLFDAANPDRYVEVRGTVTMTEEGGRELIDELSHKYQGLPYTWDPPAAVRVVFRVTPTKVYER